MQLFVSVALFPLVCNSWFPTLCFSCTISSGMQLLVCNYLFQLLYFLWKLLLHTLNTVNTQQSFDMVTSGFRSGISHSEPSRGRMASAEEKLARLEAMVETLKRNQQQPVNITVTAPPARKLKMFSGPNSELHYWIGEARIVLPSLSSAERLSFLIAHLDGPDREEVMYAPSDEKDCIDINVTRVYFWGNSSNAQMKRELYDLVHSSRESLREFSRVQPLGMAVNNDQVVNTVLFGHFRKSM